MRSIVYHQRLAVVYHQTFGLHSSAELGYSRVARRFLLAALVSELPSPCSQNANPILARRARSWVQIRSSTAQRKENRPSDDGLGTRVFAERAKILTLVAYEQAQRALRGVCEPIAAPCGTATVFEATVLLSKERKTDHRMMVCFSLAAELGFEPRHTESESAVLPLHNSAR